MSITNPTTNPTASPPPDGPLRGRGPRRLVVVVAAAVALIGLATVVAVIVWPADPRREPVVTFLQPIPDDVETEARSAVAAFTDRFASRRECVGGADVVLVDEVSDGDARYLAADGVIEIEIPTSPRRFRDSLVHELAHHVEHRCPDFDLLRDEVLTLTGADAWTGQPRWADRPSELWAESVVEVVLGERVRFGRAVPLDPALVDAVRTWAAADPG
jgi:hypothetical protein